MAFGTDYTPVGPMPTDIVLGDVDATSMRLARDIRDKGHGIDTRETMARMILKSSTMHNHLIKVNNALKVQNDEYYRQFTDVITELSEDKDYYSLPEIAGARRGYQTLIESLNNLSFNMFNTNLGKVTPNMVSDELLAQIAGDAAVNMVPGDGSITSNKLADKSVERRTLATEVNSDIENSKSTITNIVKNAGVKDYTGWDSSLGAVRQIEEGKLKLTGDGKGNYLRTQQVINSTFNMSVPRRMYVRVVAEPETTNQLVSLSVILFDTTSKQHKITRLAVDEPIVSGNRYVLEGVIDTPPVSGNYYVRYEAQFANSTQANGQIVRFSQPVVADVTYLNLNKKEVVDLMRGIPFFEGRLPFIRLSNKLSESIYRNVDKKITIPVGQEKFDEEIKTVYTYSTSENLSGSVNVYTSGELFEDDHLTYTAWTNNKATTGMLQVPIEPVKLQDYDYVDVHLKIEGAIFLSGGSSINIINDAGNTIGFYDSFTNLKMLEVKEDGWHKFRIPLDKLLPKGNASSDTTMNHFRIMIQNLYDNRLLKVSLGKVDFVKSKKGAVSLYFDDAMVTQYTNGFRLAQKYGLTGAIGVITSRTGTPGWCSWQQLRDMENAGWIVCSHTHTHITLNDNLDKADYEFKTSQDLLRRNGFIFGSNCYIAPFGSYNWKVDEIARRYYAIARGQSATSADLYNSYPQTQPRFQRYISAKNDWTFEKFKEFIDGAIAQKKEFSLTFHPFETNNDSSAYNVTPELADQVFAYIAQKRDEGVLDVVDWRDTLTDNLMKSPVDLEGLNYVHRDGSILELPVE